MKRAALESALREVMFQIVRFANEKSNHVPSVPSSHDSVSFPFDITIPRFDRLLVNGSFICIDMLIMLIAN